MSMTLVVCSQQRGFFFSFSFFLVFWGKGISRSANKKFKKRHEIKEAMRKINDYYLMGCS